MLKPVLYDNNINNQSYNYFFQYEIKEWDQYKDEVSQFAIETFQKNYNPTFGYNVLLDPKLNPTIATIYNDFLTICKRNFDNLQIVPNNKAVCWAYVQNKEKFNSVWHNHKRTASINAVWYPKVPDPTGTLSIRDGEGVTDIAVQEGYIYFWPYWMDHKPNAQKNSNDWRVSVNIELFTSTRPVHKETNTIW